jgi:hypothetical protein
MKRKTIFWITQTGMLLAMAVVFNLLTQYASVPVLITGSLVNMVLIVAAVRVNLSSGSTIAVINPVVAVVIGKLPLFLYPAVALGNLALVLGFGLIYYYLSKKQDIMTVIGLIIGCALKFGAMVLATHILINWFGSGTPDAKLNKFIETFAGVIQLITALIGSVLAFVMFKLLPKKNNENM